MYAVSDRILAAVMPAPRGPSRCASSPSPTCQPGAALLRTASFRSVRHRRPPLARPAVGCALSDHPGPRLGRHRSTRSAAPCAASTATRSREGDRVAFFDVHRTCGRCRACTVHRTPTRCPRAASTASPIRRPRGCSADGRRRSTSSRASASRGCRTRVAFDDYIGGGCGLLTAVHIIERAAIRPGDTVLVQGTGAVGLSAIALARLAGAVDGRRDRRAAPTASSSRARWAPMS